MKNNIFNFLKEKISERFIKDKKIIFVSVILGVIFTSIVTYTATYSEEVRKGIADRVLRFHVIANSDCDYDQRLKLSVRDEVLNTYREELKKCGNVMETKEFFNKNINDVKALAEKVVRREGYDYEVNAFIGKSVFPTKKYGDVAFPAGEYDALKIEIGEAKGRNWWCVMFPPLCFVDVSHNKISEESKNELYNILPEEEYGIVTSPENSNSFKVKFKIVELWEELFS